MWAKVLYKLWKYVEDIQKQLEISPVRTVLYSANRDRRFHPYAKAVMLYYLTQFNDNIH